MMESHRIPVMNEGSLSGSPPLERREVVSPSGRPSTPTSCHPSFDYINGLSADLLGKIFCYLPLSEQSIILFEEDEWQKPPSWAAVTQVCRRWREVANACKEFWSIIPLHNPAWARHALALSDPHPLTLRAPVFVKEDSPAFNAMVLALQHLPRVREIQMAGEPNDEDDNVLPMNLYLVFMTLEALPVLPALETLRIAVGGRGLNEVVQVSEDVFCGAAPPRLRNLRLDDCDIQGNPSFFCPTLTSLELNGSSDCLIWTDWQQFQDTLSDMPLLEVLKIGDFLLPQDPGPEVGSTMPPRKTVLPALQVLVVGATPAQMNAMLSCVALPLRTAISLHYAMPRKLSARASTGIAAALSAYARAVAHGRLPFEMLSLGRAHGTGDTLKLRACASAAGAIPAHVVLEFPPTAVHGAFALDVLQRLGLRGVTYLEADHPALVAELWWELAACAPDLVTMAVRGEAAIGFLDAFVCPVEDEEEIFLKLSVLDVQGIDLAERTFRKNTVFERLLGAITRRVGRGHAALKQINIDRCVGVTQDMVDKLDGLLRYAGMFSEDKLGLYGYHGEA